MSRCVKLVSVWCRLIYLINYGTLVQWIAGDLCGGFCIDILKDSLKQIRTVKVR